MAWADRGWVVAEGVGDDWHWPEFGQTRQGPEPSRSSAEDVLSCSAGWTRGCADRGEERGNTQLLFGWDAVRSLPGGQRVVDGLVQRGGECELGLPSLYGDDVVGDGDVVPGQLSRLRCADRKTMTRMAAARSRAAASRGPRSTAASCPDLGSSGLVPRRCRAMPSSALTKRHLIAQGMKRSTNPRGARVIRQPGVEVLLLELASVMPWSLSQFKNSIVTAHGLLRSEESCRAAPFHPVHPSRCRCQRMKRRTTSRWSSPLTRASALSGPLRVADGEFIASRQGAVLDQRAPRTSVACAICSWQLVEFFVGHARCDGKYLEEGRDVSLPDPGRSAVGRLHRLQRRGHRDQLGGTTPVSGSVNSWSTRAASAGTTSIGCRGRARPRRRRSCSRG